MFKSKKTSEKEEEFVKLNAELDIETKDLLDQVDQVMKLHEHKEPQIEAKIYCEDVYNDIKGKGTAESKENKRISKIFGHNNKGDKYKNDGIIANGFERRNQVDGGEEESGENENGMESKTSQMETYFSRLRAKEEESIEFSDEGHFKVTESGSEEFKDERFVANKPLQTFFSLNREKSNKNLKPTAGSAKASIISTTNIGQGLTLPGKLTRHKSESRLKDKPDATVLPESLKGMGQEGIVRFLKAKVKMLTEQLDILQKDEKKHVEKIKDLQAERERVSEDRDKWIQQANIAKNVLVKHEQHASNIVVQLQNTQAENGHLKKEIEKLKKELKQINMNSGSNEVRLNRSIEEIEKLKTALRQAKQEEKDSRETQRKKAEELSGAVKRLDKQRVELLHAFKKQLIIIDNLKKQRGLMEAGKLLKSIEDDFMEFLDWNPNKI